MIVNVNFNAGVILFSRQLFASPFNNIKGRPLWLFFESNTHQDAGGRVSERVRVWRWLCQYIFNYLTQTLLIWWPWHSAPYSPSRRPYQEEETLKQRNFFFFLCAVGFLFLFKKEKWNIGITSRICSIGLSRRSSASAVIVSDYYVTISMHNTYNKLFCWPR